MSDILERELPEGWDFPLLSDVIIDVPNCKPEAEPERDFGYVDISSIDNETFRITACKRFKGNNAPSRARRPIQSDDVLFSNVRTYLRNIALVPKNIDIQLCSTGFTVLRPSRAIKPVYLFRYLLTEQLISAVNPQQTGTHYPATTDRVVFSQRIPLAPLPEQKRIADKVESLLERVNRAKARLNKVPTILKRFRQSVLSSACSGKLTEEWREQHPEIKSANIEKKHQIYTKQKLPNQWLLCSLKGVADCRLGKMLDKQKHNSGTKIPYLRNVNVRWGYIDTNDLLEMYFRNDEIEKFSLKTGDVLVCEGGEPARAAVWRSNKSIKFQKALHRIRPSKDLNSDWVVFHLWNDALKGTVDNYCTGSTIKHFTGIALAKYPFRP